MILGEQNGRIKLKFLEDESLLSHAFKKKINTFFNNFLNR